MSPRRRLLLAACGLLALGAGAYGLRPQAREARPPPGEGRAAPPAASGPTLSGAVPADPGEPRPGSGGPPAAASAPEPPGEPPALTVAGRVLGADGRPVAGALVRLLRPTPWQTFTLADGTTLRDGGFELRDEDGGFLHGLRAGDMVLAELPGQVYAWRALEAPVAAGRLDLGDLRLRGAAGAIAGRVLGPGDEPLSAKVEVEREDGQDEAEERVFALALGGARYLVTSAADGGRFATRPLPPGLYRLTITLAGGWSHVVEHVAAGTQDLALRVPREAVPASEGPFDLRVSVTYEPGPGGTRPPAASPVFLQDRDDLSAEPAGPPPEGGGPPPAWLVRGVVRGPEPLVVSPGDEAWGPAVVANLEPSTEGREVVLPRARPLHGVVRLQGRGVPARIQWRAVLGPAGASALDPHSTPPDAHPLQGSLYTDGEGRFRVGGLPPGTVSVWVNPVHDDAWYATSVPFSQLALPRPAFHWWGWRDVSLEPEREVVFEVEAVGRAVLDLAWPDGEPRPEQPPRLSAWRHVPEGNGSDLELGPAAWAAGRLRVELVRPVEAEPLDVLLRGPAVWALVPGVRARPEPYAVPLTACARIAGVVVGPDGAPLPSIRVAARWAGEGRVLGDRWRVAERADEAGRFLLRPAARGPHVLEGSDPDERLLGLPTRAQAGDEVGEVLVRMAALHWVVGRVEGPEGRDLSEVRVRVLFGDVGPPDAASDWCTDDGFFRLPAPVGLALTLRAEDDEGRELGVLVVPADRPARDLRLRLAGAR